MVSKWVLSPHGISHLQVVEIAHLQTNHLYTNFRPGTPMVNSPSESRAFPDPRLGVRPGIFFVCFLGRFLEAPKSEKKNPSE